MGKRNRNKNNNHGTGVTPSHGADANVGSLIASISSLMTTVTTMSGRLDELSSTVNGLLKSSKNVDETVMSALAIEPDFGEFNNLKQTTTVAEYQEKFEGLMLKRNYGLSDDYLISSFLRGLKPEIIHSIGNCKPESIYHAFKLASTHEIAVQEMKDRVMNHMLSKEDNLQCEQVTLFDWEDDSFRFGALVGEREISILISPKLPYSIIDTSLAVAAGFKIEEAEPIRVEFLMMLYAAVSRFQCPNFEWTMQGHKFNAEMRLVEIKAKYSIVLGSDWVREHESLDISSKGIFLQVDGKEIALLDFVSMDDV